MNSLTGFIKFVDKMNDRMGKIVSLLIYPIMLVLVYEGDNEICLQQTDDLGS